MVGPVFFQELMLGGRRSKQRIFRWIYAGWLLLELFGAAFGLSLYILIQRSSFLDKPVPHLTTLVVEWFVPMFVWQHFIVMLLAAPVITAGAITDEKTSGTLQYLFTTDLDSFNIVVGKMLGRMAQVGILFLTGLPLFCFLGGLYGIEPLGLLAMAAVTFVWMFFLGSASLLASVWSKQTRDAVLGVFIAFAVLWLIDWLTFGLLDHVNPLEVLRSAWWAHTSPAELKDFGLRFLWLLLVWGGVSMACLAVAAWRLRPVYLRQLEDSGKRKKVRWWHARRPAISKEPVHWKERHVHGVAPFDSLLRVPRWLAVLTVFTATAVSSALILWYNKPPGLTLADLPGLLANPDSNQTGTLLPGKSAGASGQEQARRTTKGPAGFPAVNVEKAVGNSVGASSNGHNRILWLIRGIMPSETGFCYQAVAVLLLSSLMVGIRCSGAISGEREKQTWEALLLSPLSEHQLIRGKLSGILGASYLYLFACAVPALALSVLGGFWAVFWSALGLAVTWLAMRYLGAAGIWCSGRSKSSWRSLLGTLGFGYVGAFVISVVLYPFTWILSQIIAEDFGEN